jgi:hypothetical protein
LLPRRDKPDGSMTFADGRNVSTDMRPLPT